jgi:hypothetical protein
MAVAIFAATAAGCSGDSSEDGIDNQSVTDPEAAVVGTCLRFGDEIGETVENLPVTACDVPHTHEIFAIVSSGEDVYPGFEALEETALVECFGAFEEYVGVNPLDSTLFSSWLVPTLDSWNIDNDRDTLCVLGNFDGAPLTEPVRRAAP